MAMDVRRDLSEFPTWVVGLVVLILAAAGIGAWWLTKRHHASSDTATRAAATQLPPGVSTFSSTPTPPSPAPAPAPPPVPVPAATPAPAGRSRGREASARAPGADAPALPVKIAEPDKKPGAPAVMAQSDRSDPPVSSTRPVEAVTDAPAYDATDVNVTAPRLLTPLAYTPLPQGARRETPGGAIQVLVNEDGTVDAVKALFMPKTLGENLLLTNALSVAKSWRFKPAVRDGRPVKFRLVVPLSLF